MKKDAAKSVFNMLTQCVDSEFPTHLAIVFVCQNKSPPFAFGDPAGLAGALGAPRGKEWRKRVCVSHDFGSPAKVVTDHSIVPNC
jgi:hypothetical protein